MANLPQPADLVVVDEDPMVHRIVTFLIEEEPDVRVQECIGSVEAARRYVEATGKGADLVVVGDFGAGPRSGLELAAALRRRWPQAGILLYSASADEVGPHPAIDAAVPKTDPEQLVVTVRRLLGLDTPSSREPAHAPPAPTPIAAGRRGRSLRIGGLVWAAAVAAVVAALLGTVAVVPTARERLVEMAGLDRDPQEAAPGVPSARGEQDRPAAPPPTSGPAVDPPPITPAPAGVAPVDPSTMLAVVNAERAARALPPLVWEPRYAGQAHAWAARVSVDHAAAATLPPGMANGARATAQRIGGVAATGPSPAAVVTSLVASPTDAAVVLDPGYDAMAAGVVERDGVYAVAVAFVDVDPAAPAAPDPPPPAVTPPPPAVADEHGTPPRQGRSERAPGAGKPEDSPAQARSEDPRSTRSAGA